MIDLSDQAYIGFIYIHRQLLAIVALHSEHKLLIILFYLKQM